MDVTYREDDIYVYADVFDATPGEEVNVELRSKAVPPNESTEGVTAGLHKTAGSDGRLTFKAPKEFLLPDLPRQVWLNGPMGEPKVFTV